ncbi:MAG: hypothetical protein AB8C13_10735 [Phycisphaerales bacterium]
MNTFDTHSTFHDRLNLAVGETSYRQLGDVTNTHPETVRRYMQGQAPSAAFMTSLCQNLGISGEWLLSGKGPMKVRDMRSHALKTADPNELMGAIANTLTHLIERVDRLERFVQSVETRLNASGMMEAKPSMNADSGSKDSDIMNSTAIGSSDEESGKQKQSSEKSRSADSAKSASKRIGRAVSKRSSELDA